jgi:primary-amine oxidase
VRWQKWRFRVGFTFREGLVLHDIAYEDGDELRPVLRRASVNEMYVPYLDDSSTQYRKNFFDWGEYGAGQLTSSLALGCDCLGLIHYFDAAFLGADGTTRHIPQAICMHEEDHGILFRHHNSRTGEVDVRRSRRLVVSTFVTVANYDYGFYWSLYQDGAIELEIKLTGLLSASGIGDDETPAYGRVVGPNVQTPNHQHFFAVRLDAAVDGPLGRLVEVHAEPEADPARNPYGNAVRTVRTPIASEAAAARDVDPSRALHWRVESAERTNRYGDPTAYRLHLETTARPFFAPDSVAARRAPFIGHHLWATPYDPAERYIGGDYPNHAAPGSEGIHVWQRAGRSLDGAELVLWPIVGSHHYPRPEDWPIMPVARATMRLEPDGFFDRNPALDVPPPDHCEHGR